MKLRLFFILSVMMVFVPLRGQQPGNCVTDVILSGYSERNYTDVPVTGQQLETILSCGIKAPSARNNQPWKFTVISDDSTMKSLISNIVPGNVVIIISGTEPQQGGATPDFDCALATESMFIAAHGLGLGARIYGSPTGKINSSKEVYQIPAGYKAIAVLRVGNTDKNVDAVSSATPRKTAAEVVNYKK